MLVSHAIVGTAIGAVSGNPITGFVLGVGSHFIADATPHFDPGSYMKPGEETYDLKTYVWAGTDVVASFVAATTIALFHANPVAVAAGAFGAMLPDIVLNPPFWKDWTRSLPGLRWIQERIHSGWHWTVPPKDWFAGTITQVIAIVGAAWVLGF